MINFNEAKSGLHIFYQQPHMRHPEYGIITSTNGFWIGPTQHKLVFVRFLGDVHSKACDPKDLYWPPDYCRADGVNPVGQPFSRAGEYPS